MNDTYIVTTYVVIDDIVRYACLSVNTISSSSFCFEKRETRAEAIAWSSYTPNYSRKTEVTSNRINCLFLTYSRGSLIFKQPLTGLTTSLWYCQIVCRFISNE